MELGRKLVLAAVPVLALVLACGSDKAPPTAEVEYSIPQAVDQLLALESASFTLEHLQGTTVLVPGVLMTKAYGEVDIPDRFRVTVEAESVSPKTYIEISIITIENKTYMTGLFGWRWNEVPADTLPFNLSGLGQTLANIVDAIEEGRGLGQERLQGVDTVRLGGNISSEDLSELIPGAGSGFPVALELWLAPAGLLRQVKIIGRVVPTDDADTVRRLVLNDTNQPVTINPPE